MRAAAQSGVRVLASVLLLAVAVQAEQQESPVTKADEWAHEQAGAGRCQMILTAGYGYRQFVPLEAFLAPAGDNPMDGHPSPLVSPPKPTPPPHLLNATATPGPGGGGGLSSSTAASTTSASRPDDLHRLLVLRFQVMAESDAHILLSAQRRSDREAYEVVLGAGNNSYTDFRRLPASVPPRRAFNYSAGVVSGKELRAFWLLADLATGLLAVGPDGGPPILAWVDPGPLRVRYFSLCTWTDVQGTWLYGCDKAGNSSSLAAQDAEDMSPSERFRLHVLTPENKLAPRNKKNVDAGLIVSRINVDDSAVAVTVTGTLRLVWHDPRLVWSNTSVHMPLSPGDVWVPDVRPGGRCRRSGDYGCPGPTGARLVLMDAGSVAYSVVTRLEARCTADANDGGVETHTCAAALTAKYPANIVRLRVLPPPEDVSSTSRVNAVWEYVDATWVGADGGGVLHLRMRRRGSRASTVFRSTSIAACVFWVASLLLPEPAPGPPGPRGPPGRSRSGSSLGLSTPLRPRTLMAALGVLVTAVSLLSLQASMPVSVVAVVHAGVLQLSAALLLAALGLVLPTLTACHGLGLPPLPKPLTRLLRSEVVCRLLHGHSSSSQRPRWHDCPNGTAAEQVLEMLDAIDAEVTRRDWNALMLAVEKVGAVACLGLAIAALTLAHAE